ncbi:MAG: TetR/AcrR family transcriptional regulator [Parvibaculum sp.]|nr:TetR/AcrR family transcriptional regulator [Parvibaculum sp.]
MQSTLALLEAREVQSVRMGDIAKRSGISRQALYLHFKSRAELLIATTRYVEDIHDVDARLLPSRTARTGLERLDAYIESWGEFLPKIQGIAKALIVMSETDSEAAAAWDDRMQAMRSGCAAAVKALKRDKQLSPQHTVEQATDILWMLMSFQNWQQLTQACGWPPATYGKKLKQMARSILVVDAGG